MNHDTESRILVVRPGALGDTILGIPLLESIRNIHPGASFTVVGNGRYRFLMPRDMEFQSVDHPDQLWLFGSGEAKWSPPARRFGKAYLVLTRPDIVAENLKRAGTRSIVHVASRPSAGIHVVEHLHHGLGAAVPARKSVLTHLAQGERKPLLWIHPGSGGPGKCVPLHEMRALAEKLRNGFGWDAAVTAGEEDEFLKDHAAWPRLIAAARTQLLENRPLEELCGTLGRAGLFLGNDSGIGHLAANLGVPSAVLFVSTDPVQWAPWVPDQQIKTIDLRTRELTAEVLRAVADALVSWINGTR
ncbi:MAG: glycosyltransferase family 9 protein [Desulfomonilaceae bacterium]|nr:glycosyltransferase family 9 protein [Desulfomonilaceae bacterium]